MLTYEILGLVVLVLGVALAVYKERRKPFYLVSVTKVTNVNQQPETVTMTANLPKSATPADLWETLEGMGMAAVARMTTINDDIIETNEKIAAEIEARKVSSIPVIHGEIADRQRRRVAKALNVKPEKVDEILARYTHGKTVIEARG